MMRLKKIISSGGTSIKEVKFFQSYPVYTEHPELTRASSFLIKDLRDVGGETKELTDAITKLRSKL